jgi:hypothetical protein
MRRLLFGFRYTFLHGFAVLGLALLLGNGTATAQSGAQDQGQKPAANPADAAREGQRKTDEFTEAQQVLNGPAGNPECVWLGRRVVRLMWNDDLDTAFRHLDLYDRFGCPGGHVQAAFRCLTRFAAQLGAKNETLDGRVHACWINPGAQPQTAANGPATNGGQPTTTGTPAQTEPTK